MPLPTMALAWKQRVSECLIFYLNIQVLMVQSFADLAALVREMDGCIRWDEILVIVFVCLTH